MAERSVSTDVRRTRSSARNDKVIPSKLSKINRGEKMDSARPKRSSRGSRTRARAQCKRFSCGVCGAFLKSQFSLKRHEATHSSEPSYPCTVCDKVFRAKFSLKRHQGTHAKINRTFVASSANDDSGSSNAEKSLTSEVPEIETEQTAPRSQPVALKKAKRLVCRICGAVFTRRDNLRRHEAKHSSDKTSTRSCKICSEVFRMKDGLKRHQCTHPKNKEKFVASSPNDDSVTSKDPGTKEGSTLDSFFQKQTTPRSHPRPFTKTDVLKCRVCRAVMKSRFSLKRHEAKHNSEPSYFCTLCDKVFRSKFALQRHQGIHAKENQRFDSNISGTVSSSNSLLRIPTSIATTKSEHYCGQCGVFFTAGSSLKRHLQMHILRQHRNRTAAKPFPCDTCKARFTRKHQLLVHKTIHTRETSLVCDICDVGFPTNYQLKLHRRIHVNKRKVYTCHICGRSQANKNEFAKHVGSHVPKEPNVCEICGKVLSLKASLARHQLVHSDERSFVCDTCGKAFKEKSKLKTHLKTHSKEKPFLCDVCGKAYASNYLLTVHNLTHKKDKPCLCSTCGKKFRSMGALKQHKKSHGNHRPHVCNICGDTFLLKHHLKNHLGAHSNDRPFVCVVCNKAFLLNHQLRAHQQTHVIADPLEFD